jgi:hypothetical protein
MVLLILRFDDIFQSLNSAASIKTFIKSKLFLDEQAIIGHKPPLS